MSEPTALELAKREYINRLVDGFKPEDYRNAPSDIGPLAAEWGDKPHRLVYDLIAIVIHYREALIRREEGCEPKDRTCICGDWMLSSWNYCPECGTRLKWPKA